MRPLIRITLKAVLFFIIANLLFGLWVDPRLGRISAYNSLFPGRTRFPFGESPRESYSFSLFDLDAMFASHRVSAIPEADEFRVFIIGDSSVWGTLLRPDQTLAGQLDASHLTTPDGLPVRFYNLGYPTISLTKDLFILDRARQNNPDLVIWLVTLEAFPVDKQLSVPLVENNPAAVQELINRYDLTRNLPVETLSSPGLIERTIIGRRKALADLIRLQMYGVLWSATGIDQVYPLDYPRAQVDLENDPTFHGKEVILRGDLAFPVLSAGRAAIDPIPLLLVNEPTMISTGENSHIRYNFYYPRAAYDDYREWLAQDAQIGGWHYLDAWDIVPPGEFTNSAIHLNQVGTARLAELVANQVKTIINPR